MGDFSELEVPYWGPCSEEILFGDLYYIRGAPPPPKKKKTQKTRK